MKEKELLEIVREMAYDGKEYNEIKKVFSSYIEDSNSEAIEFVERQIDKYIVEYQLAIQERLKVLNKIILGVVLLSIGLGISGYTYFNYHSQYVLAYGAIFGGTWILIEGYIKYKRPIEEFVPKKRIIKRRR